ncbi:MAG: type II secretion system protein [Thermodesulfobacteriota bacterium]
MKSKINAHENGFTLLEVLVSIVMAAILGTMLTQFIGSNLSRSAEMIEISGNGLRLKTTMEQITRDYRNWLKTNGNLPGASLHGDFKAMVESHGGAGIAVETTPAGFEIDPGNDGDIEIMQVTVTVTAAADSSKNQMLQSVFTHVR